tara:strand:- start:1416 stop:1538 length:123 start_codon:yes stop_codon:yes gene_type:complete
MNDDHAADLIAEIDRVATVLRDINMTLYELTMTIQRRSEK